MDIVEQTVRSLEPPGTPPNVIVTTAAMIRAQLPPNPTRDQVVAAFQARQGSLRSVIASLEPPGAPPYEIDMITRFLTYQLPPNATRDQIVAAYNAFKTRPVPAPPPTLAPVPPPPPAPTPDTFTVQGFYGPSRESNVLSVYLVSDAPVKTGMFIEGLEGITGLVIVKDFTSNVYGDVIVNPGPPATSFPYVSLVSATVLGGGSIDIRAVSSLLRITFRVSGVKNLSSKTRAFRGPLVTGNTFPLYVVQEFQGPKPDMYWIVKGLSSSDNLDVVGNVVVLTSFSSVGGTANVLSSQSIEVATPYLYSATLIAEQEQTPLPLPGRFVDVTFDLPETQMTPPSYGIYDMKRFDGEIKGQAAELRDLNSNVWTHAPAPREAYIEMSGRGFGTGALTALAAIGAQEKYMYGGESKWIPRIIQHTPFVQTQRYLRPMETSGKFLDSSTTYSVDIFPRESGDLLSNMYLSVSLPALPAGYSYSELTGRAILKKVEFILDRRVVETLTDDWYIIRDQLFLDADDKLSMYQAISGGQSESNVVPATSPLNMIIPLEFFFCRRHSQSNKGRERLEKPFFPMCAVLKQIITVRFTFRDVSWITNAPSDAAGYPIDLIKPQVVTEEITLTPRERMYYQSKQIKYNISRVWVEAGQPYNNGKARINFTSKYPVNMMTWFVRNKLFESSNPNYYESRYQYGYSTDYIQAAVPVQFFNGVSINFLDIIKSGTIYLNNENILSNFPGALYYSYKQAMDHGLSVPTKNIYMYCFSDSPREYNQEGYVDFSKLNSNTSHLDLEFDPVLAPQIVQDYTLYMYYYGYVELLIENGYGHVVQDV